jgi:hypothetical protein
MKKIPMNAIADVVEQLLRDPMSVKVVKFISDKQIVRAVRRPSVGNIYVSLTIGHPNYAERHMVRMAKKIKSFENGMCNTKLKITKKKIPSRK